MTERKLTITSLCQSDNRCWGKSNVVPFLRLSGIWLEKVGFHIGDKVSVQVESGKLVVMPLHAEKLGSGARGPKDQALKSRKLINDE